MDKCVIICVRTEKILEKQAYSAYRIRMCKKICLENIIIFIRLTGKYEILLRVEIAVVLSVNDRVVIRELVVFCALKKRKKIAKAEKC